MFPTQSTFHDATEIRLVEYRIYSNKMCCLFDVYQTNKRIMNWFSSNFPFILI